MSQLDNEQQQISILIKGSRSARMEKVVKDIIDWRTSAENLTSTEVNNTSETSSC